LQFLTSSKIPFSPATPFSRPSGLATGSFNGLHPKSKFLAFSPHIESPLSTKHRKVVSKSSLMKKLFLTPVIALWALVAAKTAQATDASIYEPYCVTNLAGFALTSGSTYNTVSAARFNQPWGVVVDSTGIVYVADTLNQTIRMITLPGGVVTTYAGVFIGIVKTLGQKGLEAMPDFELAAEGAQGQGEALAGEIGAAGVLDEVEAP
jgi:hypothetical protein